MDGDRGTLPASGLDLLVAKDENIDDMLLTALTGSELRYSLGRKSVAVSSDIEVAKSA